MNAFSPPFSQELEPAVEPEGRFTDSAGSHTRARPIARLRAMRREAYRHWIGPLAIATALGLAHLLGVFAQLDGRFFDTVTVNQAGKAPSVVVIERDPALSAAEGVNFAELNDALVRLGVERIGYLGEEYVQQARSSVPVVVALPAQQLHANARWELGVAPSSIGFAAPAARVIAPSQYGITRSQAVTLDGGVEPIPVFDAALADQYPAYDEILVPMPRRQNIPVLKASQITGGQIKRGELNGLAAIVVEPSAMKGSLATPITPNAADTSEAIFRAHAVQALRTGQFSVAARWWEVWVVLLAQAAVLALLYRTTDPKRLALLVPVAFSVIILAACWAALLFFGRLLPVSALLLSPWIITFQRVIARETSQDRRLERTASRAVQSSFNRSALREGSRLPDFLGSAAAYAGVERSLLIQADTHGNLEALAASNASLDDIDIDQKRLAILLKDVRESFGVRDAAEIVPSWPGDARIGWIGDNEQQLYWIHTRPETATPGKSAHLVRAIATSFRELFRWRNDLNARGSQESRNQPIDEHVASAIALVANESQQVRRGFDTIDTAVIIFHLIGSPLHANKAMQELYAEAGLNVFETSLRDALLALTDLGSNRVQALIEDLMLNGSEMRMPMRDLGDRARNSERMLRVAAPSGNARGADRVLVLEAIDMRDANRAADLRQAVATFIDLQLRNDFEAVLLGSQLAKDERLSRDQVRSVVDRISETTRRATSRLDEVANLVRSEINDLTEACYPVDATAVSKDAVARASVLAKELGVRIVAEHPSVSGFTLAEPVALTEMLTAMLRVVIADTPHGGEVKLTIEELEGRTLIRISGGFGIGFGRLLWLISNYEEGAVGEYRVIGEGISKVTCWSASVSYWGTEAKGFGFNIDLRGIG